jgi:hypothetical protein
MANHPTILAFGYSYLPRGSSAPSYAVANASRLEGFQALTYDLDSVELLDVHHVSADDAFTITDVIWNRDHNPSPYTDGWVNNSWVFGDMDRIAYGKS